MSFGSRLRQEMRKASLTQEQLAKKIGVKQPSVSDWLADKFEPRGRNYRALVKLFPALWIHHDD